MLTPITAAELLLCITNEGAIYQTALATARMVRDDGPASSERLWWHFLADVALPCVTGPAGGYRGQSLFILGGMAALANDLAAHYADHLSDVEALA